MSASARVFGLVLLALVAACARRGTPPPPGSDPAAEHHLQSLRSRLADRIAREPHVNEVLGLATSDVVVGFRSAVVEELVQEVAQRYLDRVELDLALDQVVDERRDVEVSTPFGRVKAGEWRLHLVVHRVRGVLRTRTPDVRPGEGNRLSLSIPIVLEGAEGDATARFEWDAGGVAGVVCRDFELTRRVRGRVLADEYALNGQFELFAGPEAIFVRPVFPRTRFHLKVDLAEKSWADVRLALEEQDDILKCGLAIEPADILAKLKDRLGRGFDIPLPRSLFRPVELAAGVRQSVEVEDAQVDLTVKTDELRVTSDAVWYAASVRSRLRP